MGYSIILTHPSAALPHLLKNIPHPGMRIRREGSSQNEITWRCVRSSSTLTCLIDASIVQGNLPKGICMVARGRRVQAKTSPHRLLSVRL